MKDDMISRREAIRIASGYCHPANVAKELAKLPAVQTCDDDPRADVYYLAEKIGIHRLYALVVALRGEPESCDDAVSRQAAVDALGTPHGILYPIRTIEELPSAQPDFDIITKIDKAYDDGYKQGYLQGKADYERKKGKWIDAVIPNDNGGLPVQVCDQCNTFFPLAYTGGGHSFCPNCGADMRGEENETD